MYKIHLVETVKCNSGRLWDGSVGEPTSFSQRLIECISKCDEYANCKFMLVNVQNDWCEIHSSCDTTTSTGTDAITFSKRGILF